MGQAKRKEKQKPEKESAAKADAPVQDAAAPEEKPASFEPWKKPEGLSRRGWLVIGAVLLVANFPVIHYRFIRSLPEATVTVPYQDDFSSRERLEQNYWSTGGHARIVNGELLSPGVKNNPLWLKAKLPQNVAVEFDVRSMSPEGDIKVELFGDGSDHASGYIFIHGGWNNSLSVIARMDEHGRSYSSIIQDANKLAAEQHLPSNKPEDVGLFRPDTRMRVEANPYKVQIGRTYHWRIERRGGNLAWFIDGQPFMSFDDPFPLTGPKHDRFAFSSWDADLYFDNLKIEPL